MQGASRKVHIASAFQFALSGLGLLLTLPVSAALAVSAVAGLFGGENSANVVPVLSLAVTVLVIAVLLLPSGVLALLRLMGKPLPRIGVHDGLRFAMTMMLVWPPVLLAGWWVTRQDSLVRLLLPFLQIIAIGIPVAWLVEIGRHGLSGGSGQRLWGVFDFSLLITPAFILMLEVATMLALVVGFIVWMSAQPALAAQLTALFEQMQAVGTDEEAILELLRPYLRQPAVIAAILGLVAVIMPLIEEMFKPLALWFIAGRLRLPAEGFVAGLICGGAFAFVENLGFAISTVDDSWVVLVSARVGSALLHVITTGLVGWGVAQAALQRRYLRLVGLYFLAVSLHGAWNFLGVLSGVASTFPVADNMFGIPARTAGLLPVALVVLGVIFFAILVGLNRRLRLPKTTPDAVQLHPNNE